MISVLLIGVAITWLLVHLSVRHRFTALDQQFPDAYHAVVAAPSEGAQGPQLIPLAIDLMRKKHVNVPLADLEPNEKQIALFALAVQTLPAWMVGYAMIRLRPSERVLVNQLRQIKTSRPQKRQRHFGAIHQQLQSRTLGKS